MKKIAIIINENFNNRKGSFNATHARILNLLKKNNGKYKIDVYCVTFYDPWYVRILRNTKKQPKHKEECLDGVTYVMKYLRFSLSDYLMSTKFHGDTLFINQKIHGISKYFSKYNLIISHGYESSLLAMSIKQQFNIPFTATWHGSDIHSLPFTNKYRFIKTKRILEFADMNFFVSKNLLDKSTNIAANINKSVLYNGVDKTLFYPFSMEQKVTVKRNNHINVNVKNVAFIGNLIKIKNVSCLPKTFSLIYEADNKVNFHFIGDGKLRKELEKEITSYNIPVRFWGNVSPKEMPNLINCMDLVVLPSINEGLPLVTVETLACGVAMVGSKVGGIPEVLNEGYCVEHGEHFEERLSKCCQYALCSPVQNLSDVFDWEKSAEKEFEFINRILK